MKSTFNIYGFVLFYLLAIQSIAAFADETIVITADQVTPVRLCGLLKRESRWGPPGFGETPKMDVKRFVWMIELLPSAVFRYKADNDKTIENELKVIHISLTSEVLDHQLHRALGRPVVITGPIWYASSEGDMTSVIIELSSVAFLKNSKRCAN